MPVQETMDTAIKEHFKLPEEIQTLRNQANFDLYYGPTQVDSTYPGFVTACQTLADWADENLSEIFVDEDGEIYTHDPYEDPRNYHNNDPDPGDNYYFYDGPNGVTIYELKDVRRIIFGKELHTYIQ